MSVIIWSTHSSYSVPISRLLDMWQWCMLVLLTLFNFLEGFVIKPILYRWIRAIVSTICWLNFHLSLLLYLQSIPITTVENNSHQIKPNVIKSVSNLLHVFYLIMEMWYHIKRFMLNFVKRNFLSFWRWLAKKTEFDESWQFRSIWC